MGLMSTDFRVRQIRVEEWPALRALRLDMLRDPVADIAYLDTYELAAARSDDFWRDRARGSSEGGPNRQFVAETSGGELAGTVTVLVEEPGTKDFAGAEVACRQAHVVGVYVRPSHRGGAVTRELFRTAVAWARALPGVERVRLFVHKDNARAAGFYRKAGFVEVGPAGDEREMEYRATP